MSGDRYAAEFPFGLHLSAPKALGATPFPPRSESLHGVAQDARLWAYLGSRKNPQPTGTLRTVEEARRGALVSMQVRIRAKDVLDASIVSSLVPVVVANRPAKRKKV